MAGRRRRILTITVTVILVTVYAVLAYVYRGRVGSTVRQLAHIRWYWVVLAIVAESGSLASLARSQYRLLRVGGVKASLMSALALSYAANALSNILPVVGSTAGTAYAFRQWKLRGLDDATIGWAMTVSGVMSTLAFAMLAAIGAIVSQKSAAAVLGLAGAALTAIPAVALLIAVRYPRARRVLDRIVDRLCNLSRKLFHHPRRGAQDNFHRFLDRAGSLHASRKTYVLSFLMATRNWTADWLCLACSIYAANAPVPWHALLLVYCVAKTVDGFDLTPGGLGVVDAAFFGGLVAAGLKTQQALVSVVVYRLISLGLVVLVGSVITIVVSSKSSHKKS